MSRAWKTLGVDEGHLGATCDKLKREASGIRDKFLASLAFTMFAVRVAELAKNGHGPLHGW